LNLYPISFFKQSPTIKTLQKTVAFGCNPIPSNPLLPNFTSKSFKSSPGLVLLLPAPSYMQTLKKLSFNLLPILFTSQTVHKKFNRSRKSFRTALADSEFHSRQGIMRR
jgi:hypothetical protein